jgi:hypothetical protein
MMEASLSSLKRLISLVMAIAFFIAADPTGAAQPPPPYPPGFGTQEAWIQTMLHLLYTGAGGVLQVSSGGLVTVITAAQLTALLNPATLLLPGIVKPDGVTIDISSGVISAAIATGSSLGIVKPDGTTITVSGGVISAVPNPALYAPLASQFGAL